MVLLVGSGPTLPPAGPSEELSRPAAGTQVLLSDGRASADPGGILDPFSDVIDTIMKMSGASSSEVLKTSDLQ